jgi:uncharacterized lipoprotein YehR (DUF1307 family)
MKKLQLLGMAVLTALCMVAFTACGDDDDDSGGIDLNGGSSGNKGIVGDWAWMYASPDETSLFMEWIKFTSGGKFTIIDYDVYGTGLQSGGTISRMDRDEYAGSYTAKEGRLTLSANGNSKIYSYSINGNNMTLMDETGSITYDKMDNEIKKIFENAEKTYQQRFKD